MTFPVRRVAALALATALLAGCGTTQAQTAARVDGHVIAQSDVYDAMAQLNAMKPAYLPQQMTPSATLNALIQAPTIISYLGDKGYRTSESIARRVAAEHGIQDPAPSTLEVVKLANSLSEAGQAGAFGDPEAVELTGKLQTITVEVNPRFGTYVPDTASLSIQAPAWVDSAK